MLLLKPNWDSNYESSLQGYDGATDGYTEQNQNGDRNRSDMWQHGTNDSSTLTQTGDRNTNTSNQDDGDNLSTALTRVW
jgi:hypothetical protein